MRLERRHAIVTKIMNGRSFSMTVGVVVNGLAALTAVAAPTAAYAQALDLDVALEQALTTVDDMQTPTGYRVGLAVPWLFGPVGVEMSYRAARQHVGEQAQRCSSDGCTPGPFDTALRMRAVTLGVGWSVMLNPFVEMSTGVTASMHWQDIEYGPGEGANPDLDAYGTDVAGPDPGFGAYLSWRFPPLLSALRPFLFTRAEWISAGSCPADGTCFGHRYLGSAGIGMYARIP